MKPLNLVCIDAAVANRETLLAGLAADLEVHLIAPDADGLAQVTRAIASSGGGANSPLVSPNLRQTPLFKLDGV
ncbi:MAG: DUF4347 domain-containing protein [Spirulinaceae cyanobacterium RM2_2_10]|nr:DUF4347 domain-containing protein [Spirulinaceae cyanobacterium SM2_1_0]NJO19463.1 DUF4347 domain-containing protein [Spirulinaceae cyanobacterium RM2_2_10]